MPKITLKQKYRKRDISFINSNIYANDSKLCGKTNTASGRGDSNNILTILKPSFPPILTINDLTKNANTNNKPKLFLNAFIVYRMALMKEYRGLNYKFPPIGEVSKIAKNSWNIEPKHVKGFYESLVKDAKLTYKQNNIQIVLDKHMNYMENNQENDENDATYDENLQIQNSMNSTHFSSVSSTDISTDISLNNSTSINTSYNVNSIPNDQEYIRILEQIIDHLLRN